jgi:xylitol oxidase
VRALGTGHSFNQTADATGELVSVASLPPVVEIDAIAGQVIVSADTRHRDLTAQLQAAGWALPNLGSLPHVSIAGACSTGTHGSGDRNPIRLAGRRHRSGLARATGSGGPRRNIGSGRR